jgi:hypothetical protein
MIVFKHHGNFNKTEKFLTRAEKAKYIRSLEKYGREGVSALVAATPVDSGETARAWDYRIRTFGSSFSIMWTNSNVVGDIPIAIILQYGHATRNGGYVQGRDYINPALKPVFDKMADEVWREVTNL